MESIDQYRTRRLLSAACTESLREILAILALSVCMCPVSAAVFGSCVQHVQD